ncbi:Crp/Fnr family transcriptional regulator [Phenylobacterium sp.]|uniref:Crp/Fnr family transcriptional regulator n=1 Tax=Phenylobacterium sp. TaxID=1871053 RepID=UPI002B51DDA2|nr:Crp/Fnr family transcriptional regulator [Phenylobacterium sp.]HVI30839.1 Crp/Fnr family transcriptional regulator [Phenylobacterium sp.]
MTAPDNPPQELRLLIAKLRSIAELPDSAEQALLALPFRLKTFAENTDIVRQGDRPGECAVLVEGFACRYKLLGEGQRQIMSFHIPGDMPDLQSLHLPVMDHSLMALTRTKLAFVPHLALNEITRTYPEITVAFWRDTLIDAAVFREWLAGVGRRTAHQRIAHVICEVYVRMRAMRLTENGSFQLPVTQAELGDSLGLSTVHVNRVLQDLRRDRLISSKGRFVVIENWELLQAAGDFDVSYLHLKDVKAA